MGGFSASKLFFGLGIGIVKSVDAGDARRADELNKNARVCARQLELAISHHRHVINHFGCFTCTRIMLVAMHLDGVYRNGRDYGVLLLILVQPLVHSERVEFVGLARVHYFYFLDDPVVLHFPLVMRHSM